KTAVHGPTPYACRSTRHVDEPPLAVGLRPGGSASLGSSRVSLFCSRSKGSPPPTVPPGSLGEPTQTTLVADHRMARPHNYLEVCDARRRLSCAARPPVAPGYGRQTANSYRIPRAQTSYLRPARLDRQRGHIDR